MHDVLCAMHLALCATQATAGDYVCTLPAAQDSALTMGERERALLRPLYLSTATLRHSTSLPLYLSTSLPLYHSTALYQRRGVNPLPSRRAAAALLRARHRDPARGRRQGACELRRRARGHRPARHSNYLLATTYYLLSAHYPPPIVHHSIAALEGIGQPGATGALVRVSHPNPHPHPHHSPLTTQASPQPSPYPSPYP